MRCSEFVLVGFGCQHHEGRKIRLVLIIVLVILWLGNPVSEYGGERLWKNPSRDEYERHGIGIHGRSNYHQFLIASTYEYAFGNIQVAYFGITFSTFYLGSSRKSISSPKPLKST